VGETGWRDLGLSREGGCCDGGRGGGWRRWEDVRSAGSFGLERSVVRNLSTEGSFGEELGCPGAG